MKKILIGAAVGAILAATSAIAGEVQLFHDKGFWSEQLQKVGAGSQAATGVKIVETPYATAEQYKAFIQASVASGQTPNLFTWWTGETFNELVSTGQIAPLDDLWKEMIESGDYGASAKDLFMVDGQPYAVPLVMARWVVLYNKPLFAELGISEPKSWAELMAAAETIKSAGHTPFLATVQEGWRGFIWFQELLLRLHPEAYNGLNDGSVAYDSDEVREVFQTWSDMYAKGWFSDARSTEEVNDYARGAGAMYLIGEWAYGLVTAAGVPKDDVGVFIMPNAVDGNASAVIVEGAPIVVSKAGIEDEDTMAALKYFVSVDGANVWGEASGNYIGNDAANAPNTVVSKVNSDMAAAGTGAYLRWWEAVPPDLQGELVAEMNRFMLDPTMETAEDVMATMQALNAEYWADQ
ncbi:ABC transporter substrate-binding protein [Hoeflea prorocentri]|uniref:Extracellular solute-binding protein n=1 Tax=Hoeflea prorocentri TaxID=1922333 RepID=A0A9X3UK05_9HYPH|nr:extracellular solute-binding protein [Hoeflea prorocentri]MCY6381830.1 extracellular solute-binding protein [Hoeflea prorocentri]MDA5399630.1 extracellular solute-binding protein [Hoeflea prorocentri]